MIFDMPGKAVKQNYYEILEVPKSAPQNEIQKAYLRAKQTYSTDSPALYTMFTPEEASQLIRLIEEAYQTLGNITLRERYDKEVLSGNNHSSSQNELPDFSPSAEKSKPAQYENVARETAHTSPLPEGFAKTKFGVYEINEEFEEYLKNLDVFNGEIMRKIRAYKKINIDQVSAETKIGKNYLAAIESDDRDGLPADVFTRGFVAQLAKLLGLDSQKVASAYMTHIRSK